MGRPATLRVDIVTNSKGDGVARTERGLSSLGSRARKVGKVAGLGLAAVGAAALVAGKQVVDSASRQQQAYGALGAIYGKSAKRVKAWARTAADSVGLARSEYAELASVVGAQLTNMGFAQDKAANKSRDLIRTGADLAATFGGTTKEAVEALSSVLKGETDPIERYGVSIKQSDINARLAAQGLTGLTGKAAKNAQAQAVLSLVTEQTAKSHGAFAREANTLAGQQERLRAKFENTKATIGRALLPILTSLFGWLNNHLFPAAAKLGRELSARFGPAVSRVGAFVSGTLVPAIRSLFTWFMTYLYPSLVRSVRPVLEGIRSAFRQVSGAIGDNRGNISRLVTFLGILLRAMNPVRVMLGHTLGLAFRAAGFFISSMIRSISTLVSWINFAANSIQWLIGKLGALRSMSPASLIGKLGRLFSDDPLTRMVSPTTGGIPSLSVSPALSLAGLATAAAPGGLLDPAAFDATRATYVDARDFSTSVQVDGALDPAAVARQLERILADNARRMGRSVAFGGAR